MYDKGLSGDVMNMKQRHNIAHTIADRGNDTLAFNLSASLPIG